MPIAKETLRIGFVVVANPGSYVTKQAVEDYGWHDLVTDGPDLGGDRPQQQRASAPQKKAADK